MLPRPLEEPLRLSPFPPAANHQLWPHCPPFFPPTCVTLTALPPPPHVLVVLLLVSRVVCSCRAGSRSCFCLCSGCGCRCFWLCRDLLLSMSLLSLLMCSIVANLALFQPAAALVCLAFSSRRCSKYFLKACVRRQFNVSICCLMLEHRPIAMTRFPVPA